MSLQIEKARLTLLRNLFTQQTGLIRCLLTWQSFGPLDSGDDPAATQPVQGGHEACGGVGQGAVVAGVDGVRLDGL